jgi:hypothetical protein
MLPLSDATSFFDAEHLPAAILRQPDTGDAGPLE